MHGYRAWFAINCSQRRGSSTFTRTFSSTNGLKQHTKMHNNGKNVSGNTAVEEREGRASNEAGILEKTFSIEKMNAKGLESDEAKKDVQPVSLSENQVHQIIKYPKWKITKELKVTVYKVPEVEKLLSKEYRCPICHQVYCTELDLRQHKFTHKDEHKCSICGKRFQTMTSLRFHVSAAHRRPNKDPPKAPGTDHHKTLLVQPKSQPAAQETRRFTCEKPLERSRDDEAFSCPLCKVGFLTERLLATHLLTHPESMKAKEKNNLEARRMELEAEEMDLKMSKSEEHPSPEKMQQDSEEAFLSSSSESSEPEGLYKNELPCPHCKKVFDSRPSFCRHLVSHKECLKCPFCKRRFTRNIRREEHIWSKHIGRGEDLRGLKVETFARLFNCKRCPRSFWNERDEVSHRACHRAKTKAAATGKEQPRSNQSVLRCGNCPTVFRHRSNWKRHLKKAHPGQTTPYRCFICGARFVGRKKQRQHLEGHLDK